MKILGRILNWIWNAVQVFFAFFALVTLFSLPDPIDSGKEVVWVLGHPIPVDGEAFGFWIFHFELLTIVGAFALIYVLVGFLQAAYVPKTEKWMRGANWVASAVVAIPLLWAWCRLIFDPQYGITLFQQQVLYMITLAVILDVCMGMLLPWIGRIAKKVADATKTPP